MKIKFIVLAVFCLTGIFNLLAQQTQQGDLDAETLKSANDPMARKRAFNVHNYIMPSLYNMPDAAQNQLMFRYMQPVGKILLRATLPVATFSAPNTAPKSGLGDLNIFAIHPWKFDKVKIGVGALLTAPTGTNGFSQDKWLGGIAALAFFGKNPIFQSGALIQWQTDFAGKEDAADVNQLTTQLFGMWQLGGGTYLRSTGIWSFNLENGNYNIPLGLGIGKVIKTGGVVFNIFAEPQFSVLTKGAGQSRFQVFVGFNTQF